MLQVKITVFVSCLMVGSVCLRAQTAEPATAAQAAAVLDLSVFPMVDPADENNSGVIASQSYQAKGKCTAVAGTIQKRLVEAGWTEMPGAAITDEYASVMFQKEGFTVSLSVMPGSEPDKAFVSITNHGNVDLKKLPMPGGAKELYAMPMMAMFMTSSNVADTNAKCKKLLAEQGWEPFGDTTVSFFVKKNAVRLQVMVSESPAEAGKTAIQISCEQLSADLPAPPDALQLQYSDATGQYLFDSPLGKEHWVEYFTTTLGKGGWKPTTENLVKIDFREHLIFRNPQKDMIELQFSEFEGKTRIQVQFQSAALVAEMEKMADEAGARARSDREVEMERKNNPPKISNSLFNFHVDVVQVGCGLEIVFCQPGFHRLPYGCGGNDLPGDG